MKCVICKQGTTSDGTTTVTLERGESIIVIKDVPAQVCQNCGEFYLDEKTTEKIQAMAEQAMKQGVVVEILRYAA